MSIVEQLADSQHFQRADTRNAASSFCLRPGICHSAQILQLR